MLMQVMMLRGDCRHFYKGPVPCIEHRTGKCLGMIVGVELINGNTIGILDTEALPPSEQVTLEEPEENAE